MKLFALINIFMGCSSIMSLQTNNLYDDNEEFFTNYLSFRENSPDTNILEFNSIMSLLPDVSNLNILDIGCGYGNMCKILSDRGAASVTGIDISHKMINLATKESLHYKNIKYINDDIYQFQGRENSYDLILSSLCLHYLPETTIFLKKISSLIKNKGEFIFSQEHPICTSYAGMDGWIKSSEGSNIHWPIDNYAVETLRENLWLGNNITKYHRRFSTIMNGLIENKFNISRILEPCFESSSKMSDFYNDENRRPRFLIVKCVAM